MPNRTVPASLSPWSDAQTSGARDTRSLKTTSPLKRGGRAVTLSVHGLTCGRSCGGSRLLRLLGVVRQQLVELRQLRLDHDRVRQVVGDDFQGLEPIAGDANDDRLV